MKKQMNKIKYTDLHIRFFRYSIEYRIVPARVQKHPSSQEIGADGYKNKQKKKVMKNTFVRI